MKRYILITIFIGIFILLYTGMHVYVFKRLGSLLGVRYHIGWVVGILVLSFILAHVLEKLTPNKLTRIFYMLSTTWSGILFLFFSVLLVFELINLIIPLPKFVSGVIIIGIVALLAIYSLINSLYLTVKTVEIPIQNLAKELKIVHLSDIHCGTVLNSDFLKIIVSKTNKLRPDIVVITGDLVDGSALLKPGMFDELNHIKAPIYFVTGNHETYEHLPKVLEILQKTKLTILLNETVSVQGLMLMGLDFTDGTPVRIPKIKTTKPIILLYHAPVELHMLHKAGITLLLAGHTHNGQLFPFSVLVKLAYPYIYGLHTYKNTYSYVSSGTGTWGPPMRLGSKNEISLIILKKIS